MRDYRLALRNYRDRLGPARNANEAVDRLLLGSLAADPADLMSGAIENEYQSASRRWPNDVELAWLASGTCNAGCDGAAITQRLLTLDPDNAASWMVAMADASSDRDEAGFAYALQRAAGAKIYDPRMGIVFLHARTLLAGVPIPDSCHDPRALASLRQDLSREPTDDDRIDALATSMDYAISMPSFSGVAACFSGANPLPDALRKPCLAALSKLAQGDTLVEQSIAAAGLLRMKTDPARLALLRERYRQLQWLQYAQRANAGKPLPEHYLTRMWSQGEVATLQALAIERHQGPPPPDWLPDNPEKRALITGEGPPPH